MSTPPAIRVQGLWKEYVVHHAQERHGTFYDLLASGLKAPLKRLRRLGGAVSETERFWALRDLSFDIAPGEVVGVIGRNGAGKSTLLKILSRITAPTRGRVEVRGRLASLLEVGTGFHPELSGRENIFLNGAILGMTRAEVASKFDEIVAFAEVEKFIDTPVKRYSSGMYVRLAFAVAAHLEPDLLVIDEVLAVGDASFQKRCLGKIKDVAGQGRTVLFVSHNMLAVQRLCTRAIWLDTGSQRADGSPEQIVAEYLRAGSAVANARHWSEAQAPGSEAFRLLSIAVRPADGAAGDALRIDQTLLIETEYEQRTPDVLFNLSLHLFSSDDTLVCNAIPVTEPKWFGKPFPRGRYRCTVTLPANLLNADTYRIELLAVHEQNRVVFRDDSALHFELLDVPLPIQWHGRIPGVIRPNLPWTTERLS